MRSLRWLFHVRTIAKASRPFHFRLPSRILAACSKLAQPFLSKAPSVKSTMPASGSTQQNETDSVLNSGNHSIANDKKQKHRDYTARRKRRRQGRIGQHADLAHPDGTVQAEGQPSLKTIPNSRIRQVLSSSKAQKIPKQPTSKPSVLSKSVISAMDQPQGPTTPPATPIGSEAALQNSTLTSLNPSMSSATPSSDFYLPKRPAPRIMDRLPPHPNAVYLSIASLIPTRLSIPQRLLIVLDLNGTLLFREVGSINYKPRPFLMNFLDYCIENHVVLIWSSAKPHNVEAVCKQLFTPEQHQKLLGTWGRNMLGLTPLQYNAKTQVYKHLDRIWADPTYACRHPWFHQQGFMWSQKNTLLVDDSILKASAQPYNHIEIPEFIRNSDEAKAQCGKDVLGQVTAYLEEARMWDNVSAFVRQTRFEVDRHWAWDWGEEKKPQKKESELRNSDMAIGGTPIAGKNKEEETVKLSDDEEEEDGEEGGVKLPNH